MKFISCLLAAIVFLFISCSREQAIDHTSYKQEIIIFDELTHLVTEDFDPQNENHKKALLAKINDDDILERLSESSIIIDFFDEYELVNDYTTVFETKIPTMEMKAIKSILTPSQFKELTRRLKSKKDILLKNEYCYSICWTIGYTLCPPLFELCPIRTCTDYYCNPGYICDNNSQCIPDPNYEPDPPCDYDCWLDFNISSCTSGIYSTSCAFDPCYYTAWEDFDPEFGCFVCCE